MARISLDTLTIRIRSYKQQYNNYSQFIQEHGMAFLLARSLFIT
jgi:hypothetical protein